MAIVGHLGHFGSLWSILGHVGPFLGIWGHRLAQERSEWSGIKLNHFIHGHCRPFGPFWSILGHFGPFRAILRHFYLPPSKSTLQWSRPSTPPPSPPAVAFMISTPMGSKVCCSINVFENSSLLILTVNADPPSILPQGCHQGVLHPLQ